MHILTKQNMGAIAIGSVLAGTLVLSGTAFAAGKAHGHMVPRPAVVGTVASVSGTTFTVTSPKWNHGSTTPMTYTVDASGAAVTKNGATSTVSDIAVGDHVMVRGTVNGTNVTASAINDGKALGRPMAGKHAWKPMAHANRGKHSWHQKTAVPPAATSTIQ